MSKHIRRLFTLAVLTVIGTAVTCRIVLRRNGSSFLSDNSGFAVLPVVANKTLLNLAADEPAEEKERREIENLLVESRGNQTRFRSISSWHRLNVLETTYVKFQPRLRSRKYHELWPQFRESLHGWFRNRRFEPEIMTSLVDLIKRRIDQHYGVAESLQKYASCAVVGNSGILLNTDHGTLIDSHMAVIRLNNARIKGFEQHVGSKTTIAFVNSNILHRCSRRESCFCHPYGERVPIVMYICQAVHFVDYVLCNGSHKAPLLITDARFDMLCSRIVKYYSLKRFVVETGKGPEDWGLTHEGSLFHYSSGMQAVMLALGICDGVSIFGFGKSPTTKHHYHTNQKSELQLHDYEAEYIFYRDLMERPQGIPFLRDSLLTIPPVFFYQ